MESKINNFFDSIGSFFTGGDQLPWCDRDIVLSLKKEKVLRIFKLNTGQDDDAIVFMDDYLSQIEVVEKRMEGKRKEEIVVLEWFRSHVIVSKMEPSIKHQELDECLRAGDALRAAIELPGTIKLPPCRCDVAGV